MTKNPIPLKKWKSHGNGNSCLSSKSFCNDYHGVVEVATYPTGFFINAEMELAGVIAMSTKLFTLQALLDANAFSRYGFGRLYIYNFWIPIPIWWISKDHISGVHEQDLKYKDCTGQSF